MSTPLELPPPPADSTPRAPLNWLDLDVLSTSGSSEVDWFWHGYLARGSVTLLTSQWKAGKTTLLSVLLSRLHEGGELAGLAVKPGRAAVVSEEDVIHWRRRRETLSFGPLARLVCRPFPGKPSREEWLSLVAAQAEPHAGQRADLVVLDTLSAFLPMGIENQSDGMVQFLRPLEQLTRRGMAVLLLHHPRKGNVQAGQAARGAGTLSSYADILIEMDGASRCAGEARRRRLKAWSRYSETPRELVIELAQDGRDYQVVHDAPRDPQQDALDMLQDILRLSTRQLTRRKIRMRWPDRPQPSDVSIWRWRSRAVSLNLIVQAGAGSRDDPFRYQLPGRDLPFELDPCEALGFDG